MRRFAPLLCLLWLTAAHAGQVAPLVPNPDLTPGAVLTTDVQTICKHGYTATVRHVTLSERKAVFKAYGIPYSQHHSYELDHNVSLELGGSNAIANLWPQSYRTMPNARTKDRLENELHRLVCAGKLGIRDAQQAIRGDWRYAYAEYIGGLPARD